MKEIKISSQFLERMLVKGNKINCEVIEGLDNSDEIVDVTFNEGKKEIILWCDSKKIEEVIVTLKDMEELK